MWRMCVSVLLLNSSLINFESSDHKLDGASCLFGQHMFFSLTYTLHLTYECHQEACLCVYVDGCWTGGYLSVHLCLWVDGAVGRRLCHICAVHACVCVWDRITDGLECVSEAAVSQLVVIFHEAYETQLAVCVSSVYFCLSDCGTAHCV